MVRWMYGIKVIDRFTCSELKERLGIDDIITVIKQHRLRWYRDENVSAKKCMNYEVEGVRPRGRPMKTWSEVTEKDYQTRQLCKEDAMRHRELENVCVYPSGKGPAYSGPIC